MYLIVINNIYHYIQPFNYSTPTFLKLMKYIEKKAGKCEYQVIHYIIKVCMCSRYNDMADAADGGNNFHPFLRGNNPEDNPATILHYC